ncbi:orotate phosphoribosyltransferase [Pelobium manganitolerans]|uniref:Orotate phosphoribosyltransferase n=1 Tax=Pelobium manganitolerans TaxID=1842495 RepID=A0A419S3T8_9SPHI|nr:SRPBCC family protein [Pelobium manganitolerans]RKD14317.1 orotate phosphoribosyltransferase [Pelobium manganitolerans]
MTTFESSVAIAKPVEEVFAFLSDLNNHQQLMPENIYNWSSSADEARFTIQNMAKLVLKVTERIQNQEILIEPAEQAPFALNMRWLTAADGAGTTAKLVVAAELNMMLKMMASGPLQKLVDHQVATLAKVLG